MTKQTNTKLVPALRFKEFGGEWIENKLGNISKFTKGKGLSKADIVTNGMTKCIRYGQLYTIYDELIDEVESSTNLQSKDLVLSKANDVIIPASGETQIDIATASCVLNDNIGLGGDLNIIRTELNGIFLAYYLNSEKKFDIARLAQGSSVVHLYSSQLKTLKLNIPSLPEQQKIASFLSAIDEKINQLTQKATLLNQYKKGVMQKLFSQELRFKQEDGSDFPDWEEKKLGEFFCRYDVKSTVADEHIVLTSSNKGLILQSDYYGENRLTNRANIGLNIIPKDFITYRSRSDNRKFTFNKNKLGITGLISTYYPVFKTQLGDSSYFVEFLNFNQNHIGRFSVGTSQTVLSFNELKKIKFNLPEEREQQKIANYLMTLDDKLEQVNTQIEKAKAFKKGLLQQMFV